MELKDIYENINLKSLIIGAALFAFIVVLATEYNLDILLIFSSVGLLYIGYGSRNKLQSVVLGAIGTLPLFIATVFFERLGPITGENITLLILISFLAIGAFCGFTGFYFSENRKKAIGQ
ncbi:hypothetical protein ALNOE001_11770 [Candidatus Methanobinarius endosymbioticus]|uniref:Uncharacterized protein n=1 Tax=Candidatus Methanobinarius endosymbioticus TaxID=2006182 RepID=A0A366MBU5_9EURY|nr:hypothetical protein ALNOE001_11770 [Candidatus Methanobinarius endosymbioticus]